MNISEGRRIKGNFFGKSIISFSQFSSSDIYLLFSRAEKMQLIARNAKPSKILAGKIVVLLFFEPSSRTLASFDAAVKQLGGQTVVITNPQQFSSVAKGESFEDTIKVFEAYSDAIILRHPETGSAQKAAEIAKYVPIINAGDGIGEHPTQALLDLYTIYKQAKNLSNLTGLVAGDLKNGRTVHSLLQGLLLFPNNKVFLLSPKQLKLQKDMLKHFKDNGLKIFEISKTEDLPKNADFWYWTRVQKERFKSKQEYQKLKNKFIVTKKLFEKYAGGKTILMHPLPRVGEIEKDLDQDPRSVFLTSQTRNGMYIRMALLDLVLRKN